MMKTFEFNKTPLEGSNLIEASAGTGKTYTIALLILRLILEKEIDFNKILVVTFTNAATTELKERIIAFLQETRNYLRDHIEPSPPIKLLTDTYLKNQNPHALKSIEEAVLRSDEAAVFTIHSFCSKVLADHAFETGSSFSLKMLTDASKLLQEITEDFWRIRFFTLPSRLLFNIASGNLSPEKLIGQLRTFLNHPKIILKKESIKDSALIEAWNNCKAEWQTNKKEIQKILSDAVNSKILNGRSFPPSSLPNRFAELDYVFSTEEWNKDTVTLFERFSQSNIEAKTNKGQTTPTNRFFELCENLLILSIRWELTLRGEYLDFTKKRLKQRKEELGVRSFDDLLTEVDRTLFGADSDKFLFSLRKKYQAALIDEFQDTDSLQYGIFQKIFTSSETYKPPFFMIGDPKQAIYRFRGGDIFSFLQAKESVNACYTLNTNYRSQAKLIEALNALFNIKDPFLTPGIDYEIIQSGAESPPLTQNGSEVPPLVILNMEKGLKENDERITIAKEIQKLLNTTSNIQINQRPIQAQDIAILTHSNSKATIYKRILNHYGIKAVISKGKSVFQGEIARHLHLLLQALVQPTFETRIRALALSLFFNFTPAEIQKMIEKETEWQNLAESLTEAHQNLFKRGIAFALEHFFEQNKIYPHLIRQKNGERLITDLRHLIEILHKEEQITGRLPFRLLAHYEESLNDPSGEENEQRLESDENAVNILTIHKSKGLQYPVVFIPFFTPSSYDYNNVYHDINTHQNVIDLRYSNQENTKTMEKHEIDAEYRRLYYVALTRAEFRVYTVHKKTSIAPSFPFLSPFISTEKVHTAIDIRDITADTLHQGRIQTLPLSEIAGNARSFHKTLKATWETGSYSSLVVPSDISRSADSTIPAEGIFAFPRGPRAGEALHEIFEKIDFRSFSKNPDLDKIQEILSKYHISGSIETVKQMVINVLATRLGESNQQFSLNQISGSNKIAELEFYIRANNLNTQALNTLFQDENVSLKESAKPGFLKGFIDLFFRMNNRYYLIDWKSNHLGNSYSNYVPDILKTTMQEHQYIFQLNLYTLALTRYLKSRLPDFDYNRDFGGAYYIFLRGIQADPTANTGIYFQKPDAAVVAQMEQRID